MRCPERHSGRGTPFGHHGWPPSLVMSCGVPDGGPNCISRVVRARPSIVVLKKCAVVLSVMTPTPLLQGHLKANRTAQCYIQKPPGFPRDLSLRRLRGVVGRQWRKNCAGRLLPPRGDVANQVAGIDAQDVGEVDDCREARQVESPLEQA